MVGKIKPISQVTDFNKRGELWPPFSGTGVTAISGCTMGFRVWLLLALAVRGDSAGWLSLG
jgi:hypothetical protein